MNDQVIQFRGTIYENGYGLIAQKVMRDKDLSPIAKAIYSYLCSFAGVGKDGERSAFPGVSLMKKEIGIKTNGAYYKHRNQLIQKGYISIEKQRQEGQRFYNNIYYINAVPVETEESPETQEKEPLSEKRTTEPLSVSPTTVSPTTVKRTTNSNRFLSLIGFKEEEDNNKNVFLNEIGKYLDQKKYDIEIILDILNNLRTIDTNYLSMIDVFAQYEHMMKKTQVEVIYDHKKYFVEGLKKRAKNNKVSSRYAKDQEQNKEQSQERKRLYFNWLED